jgi:hypothetical protein
MGAERLAHLRLPDGQRVIARATGPLPPVGAEVGLIPRAAQSAPSAQLFDRETGVWLADIPLPYNAEMERNST